MEIKTKGNHQILEQDMCRQGYCIVSKSENETINMMYVYNRELQLLRWIQVVDSTEVERGGEGTDGKKGKKRGAEGRDNGEGWERVPHAALYDGYNDHYLVQCLDAGAAKAGMTSPTGASSGDQTQGRLGLLATHCAQLNFTDVSSKCKRSREYTQGNTTALCILKQWKKRGVLTEKGYSGGGLWKVECCAVFHLLWKSEVRAGNDVTFKSEN